MTTPTPWALRLGRKLIGLPKNGVVAGGIVISFGNVGSADVLLGEIRLAMGRTPKPETP